MSTISPGPATNSGTTANVFEGKTADPGRVGKETEPTKGANASMAAHSFEQRAAESGGVQH